jgi:hypothetical protein
MLQTSHESGLGMQLIGLAYIRIENGAVRIFDNLICPNYKNLHFKIFVNETVNNVI